MVPLCPQVGAIQRELMEENCQLVLSSASSLGCRVEAGPQDLVECRVGASSGGQGV